jgi:hypothetical protein
MSCAANCAESFNCKLVGLGSSARRHEFYRSTPRKGLSCRHGSQFLTTNRWVSLVLLFAPGVAQGESTHADDLTIRWRIILQISARKRRLCPAGGRPPDPSREESLLPILDLLRCSVPGSRNPEKLLCNVLGRKNKINASAGDRALGHIRLTGCV